MPGPWFKNRRSLTLSSLLQNTWKNQPFFERRPPPNTSFLWKGICKSQDLMRTGICYGVGTGAAIRIWEDHWIPNNPQYMAQPRSWATYSVPWVYDLVDQSNMAWNTNVLEAPFDQATISSIAAIKLPIEPMQVSVC